MARIAFVSTMSGSAWGGSEALWNQTATRLRESDEQVTASVCWWPQLAPQIEALRQMGCALQLRRVPTIGPGFALRRYTRRFLATRPDLVVISQGANYDGLPWMEACAAAGIPYVVIAHAASELLWPPDEVGLRLADGYCQARASFFVSQSNLELTQIQMARHLPNACVVRNPYSVPYDAALPWPEENGVFRLAYAARLEFRAKGPDILFQILKSEKWRGRPLHVTLYGSGINERMLRALHEMYCLENISFGGYQKVETIWAQNHAMLLSSRWEGLPISIVEAMLCGRPCIVTDVGGNAELMTDNVTGFVAAAPTVPLFDEAMERAWARRDEWRAIGLAAAEQARAQVPRDPVGAFIALLRQYLG